MPRHGDDEPAPVARPEPEADPEPAELGSWRRLSGVVPKDVRESMAELREPGGLGRAARWLLVALVYSALGVGLWLAMLELYFGGEMAMQCDAVLQSETDYVVDTAVGALPGLARSVLLIVPATWLCRKITGYTSDEPGLARALLVGHVEIPNSNIYNYIYITLLGGGSEDNPWRGWRQKDAEGHRQLLNINVGLNESN